MQKQQNKPKQPQSMIESQHLGRAKTFPHQVVFTTTSEKIIFCCLPSFLKFLKVHCFYKSNTQKLQVGKCNLKKPRVVSWKLNSLHLIAQSKPYA